VFSHTFTEANLISTLTELVEFNHKSDEYKEKSPFSKYFNSPSLLTLKSHTPGKDNDNIHSFTITFSHL
jgi:hypothetical protein